MHRSPYISEWVKIAANDIVAEVLEMHNLHMSSIVVAFSLGPTRILGKVLLLDSLSLEYLMID